MGKSTVVAVTLQEGVASASLSVLRYIEVEAPIVGHPAFVRAGQEADDIGVLLDVSRLAEVAQSKLAPRPCLRLTTKLGDGDDRYLQILG